MSIKTEFAILLNGKPVIITGESLKYLMKYNCRLTPTGKVISFNGRFFPLYELVTSASDWFKEDLIKLSQKEVFNSMSNEELAKKCKEAGGCYKCHQDIKKECLKNDCWKSKDIKERMCPAVKYGEIPRQATFVSVWDGGYTVESTCFVNLKTKEIVEIETVDVGNQFDILEAEFVVIGNVRFPVHRKDECCDGYDGYWYEA